LHTCCCIVFVCLNSNLCLNSIFCELLWKNSKRFSFFSFLFSFSLLAQILPGPANPPRGPALRSPVGQPAHSTALPLSRCQVGPVGHHLLLARTGRAPARAAPRLLAGRAPAPPPLGPHAQATRDAYKSRRHRLPYPFRPYPRNPSFTAPSQTLARRRRFDFPSVFASPPTRSSAGASRGGEEAARVACVRSHALNRRRELAGVASAPPAALLRCAPPSSPTSRSGCVG
jgi:hypothetical protein